MTVAEYQVEFPKLALVGKTFETINLNQDEP